MIPTNGLAAKTTPAAALARQTADTKGTAQGATKGDPNTARGQDFAALFTALTAGTAQTATLAGGIAGPAEEAGGMAGEALLKHSLQGRAKNLLPEDVIPPELMAFLYQGMPAPQPSATLAEAAQGPSGTGVPAIADAIAAWNSADSAAPAALSAKTDASFAAALASTLTAAGGPAPAPGAIDAPATRDESASGPVPLALAESVTAQGPRAALTPMVRSDGPMPPRTGLTTPPRPQERTAAPLPADAPGDMPALAEARSGHGGEEALAPAPGIRNTEVAVLRQETVLPPPGHPPVSHQAAAGILGELRSSEAEPAQATAAGLRPEAAPGPARVLHLQLQPQDLGVLTVRLTLRDNALEVRVEAAEQRTARMLEADRERLTDILRQAGYSIDTLTVQPAPQAEKPTATQQNLAGGDAGSGAFTGSDPGQNGPRAGGAQPDARRGQASHGERDQAGVSGIRGKEGDHAHTGRPGGGDLYI